MEDSIFTKIIKGEIPCHKVYEDEYTFAFMDIHPIQPGHVLVVTKKQVENFYELPSDEAAALIHTTQLVAKRLKKLFPGKRRIGVMIEGLDVPHVHVKVFPINSGAEFRHDPDLEADPDHTELAKLAEQLSS